MGFAELSIATLAAEYGLSPAEVCALCDRLEIAYGDSSTCLALEDAKAVILAILSQPRDDRCET